MLVLDYVPYRHNNQGQVTAFVPDSEIEPWVKETIKQYGEWKQGPSNAPFRLRIAQEMIITMFRVAVKEGLISSSEIELQFNGDVLRIDRFGRIENWPTGFCDYYDDFLNRLLDWSNPDGN